MSTEVLDHLPALDRDADSPIWFQLMRILEYGISSGVWAADDQLPSEHELCTYFAISRTSVREALARLETAGIIRREQGRGAFVQLSQSPWSWTLPSAPGLLGELTEQGRSALTSQVLRAGVETLPPWAAAVFQDSARGGRPAEGFVLERLRAVGTMTAVHVVNYMPRRFSGIAAGLRDPRASLYAALESIAGVRISRMHRTVEAVSADRQLAQLLGIEAGHPIVVIEAVAYDQNDAPVDFSRASVRTDRLRVTVDTGHEPAALSRTPASGSYPELQASELAAVAPFRSTPAAVPIRRERA
jgi:GntR family transcriptional regulator